MGKLSLTAGLCALVVSVTAGAHGLMPSRLAAPSGSPVIGYTLTAINFYDNVAEFRISCYRESFSNPVECRASPKQFRLLPRGSRKVNFRLNTNGVDGLYLVCSEFIPPPSQSSVVTRVCVRFGVGDVDLEAWDGGQP